MEEPPEGKPTHFLNPPAETDDCGMPYPGADDPPIFDAELEDLPPLDNNLPMRGKGPTAGYEARHRLIAKYHAWGYTNNQIARHLGYSPTAISLALNRPFVRAEIERVRALMFDPDVMGKMKETATIAADHIQRTILDEKTKEEIRSTNARWAVEKVTGKPKQEVSVESNTLTSFMELAREMISRGEVIDVSPVQREQVTEEKSPDAAEPQDKWTAWIATNL